MQARSKTAVTWPCVSATALWKNFRGRVVRRKFVQDVGVLTTANLVAAGLSFVQGILVARWLGPEHYGVIALVMSYPALIYAVFDARSVAASVRYLGEYHSRGEAARAVAMCKLGCLIDFAVAGATFGVVAVSAPLVARNIVHDPSAAGLMIVYGGGLVLRAAVGTSNAVLSTLGRFRMAAAIEVGASLLRLLLVFGFLLAGWQVAGVVLANTAAAAIAGLVHGATARVLVRCTWGGSILGGSLKALDGRRRQIFGFLGYTNLTALVRAIPTQLDVIVLGLFQGPTDVGYYKLAKSIAGVVRYVTKPLQTVTYPALARLTAAADPDSAFAPKVRHLLTRVGLPLGLLVLAGGALCSLAVPALVGEAYRPAVAATQLLCVGAAIALVFFWTRPVYLATGHVRQLFVISSSVTITFALFFPLIIRHWGYMGAAAWMLVLQIVATAVSASWLWKQVIVGNHAGRRSPSTTAE